jgi:hypothetical protein
MSEPTKDFEAAWAQLSRVVNDAATLKEIAELFFRKGHCVGMDAAAQQFLRANPLTPEDEAKLASVTISEKFNHAHFGEVLEAQKQTQ